MKGLLLRVGIDKGSGGCLAPISRNRSFDYIPIPERQATSEIEVYATMKGMTGRRILDSLDPKIQQKIKYFHPHHDPEFDTYTYGDPTKTKRNQLSKLKPGDLLIFYVGLEPKDWEGKPRLFVIGYFDVEEVYDFREKQKEDYDSIFRMLPNNAHSKRYFKLKELQVEYADDNLVIVKGKSMSSKIFKNALLLGDDNDKILKELVPIFGYDGSLKRAVGHKIREDNFQKVKEWLNKGGIIK